MNINNNHMGTSAHGRVRAMASSYSNGITSPSQIPLPKYTTTFRFPSDTSPQQSTQQPEQNGNEYRWKTKYEEAERKRKTLLTENQKSARDYANLERRFKDLNNECNGHQRLLQEKTQEFIKLKQASEGLFKEYEKLKNKYDVETTAMHSAMKTASQWYSQNRELKRKSAVLVQKFLEVSPAGVLELADEGDNSNSANKEDDELEGLRNTVKGLSEEVARLQTELKTARLQEFEAQEQVINLTAQLEEECSARSRAETELRELRAMKENMGHVSKLVAVEMASLREQCVQEREVALRMKSEANAAQKERNVLAHQSALLLSEVVGDEKLLRILQEVESLKRQMEEQQQKHAAEMLDIQEKLEQAENDAQLEVLQEKLKLSESELECALQRAERAEKQTAQLSGKVNQLEEELDHLKCPPPPPPPPLPPPPPPPPIPSGGISMPRKASTISLDSITKPTEEKTTGNPVLDMANMLGIPRKMSTAPQSGAIDDIINQIKGGRFTLRTPEKQQSRKEEETPAAVQEMLNVLGTLKRRQKNPARQSPSCHQLADVAL
ncbi:hypothetical protein R5R35_005365 [Gryllus longicercus]|uniref:Shootin-1 n=1 Tax=Gryllus longicercus TaxID=2509291 RepID=A0AAN9VFH5_9ORTH